MKNYIIIFISTISLVACTAPSKLTRGDNFPKMYDETPTSILIMPPINNTVSVEAKEYFYTSLALPLCEKGYYVVSPFLAMDFLRSESAYDSELFLEADLTTFRRVFGADIVLFTTINR